MYQSKLDSAIISKVKTLNGDQKSIVLDYLEKIPKMNHSKKLYRRRAMKQIREALSNPY